MLAGLSYETIGFLWLGALVGGIALAEPDSRSASPHRQSGCTTLIPCSPEYSSPAAVYCCTSRRSGNSGSTSSRRVFCPSWLAVYSVYPLACTFLHIPTPPL